MISIERATERDCHSIVSIGKISVAGSHKGSSPDEIMHEFLERNYNTDAITKELNDPVNLYHIIHYGDQPAGFSKIIFNAAHPNIAEGNVAKLDRIYLLKEFHDLKLGLRLLNFNIELSKENGQSGIWLYAWTGNARAINFYLKTGFSIIGDHKYYVTGTHYDESYQLFLSFPAGS